jgi:hypothetical protein
VPKIVGGDLIRARSQTVYYVLTRMKGICKVYLDRRRARAGTPAFKNSSTQELKNSRI